jgi:hypothetical protein
VLKLFQTDLGVSVSRFGACIVPSRGKERGPVASMGSSSLGVTMVICRRAYFAAQVSIRCGVLM